MSSEKASNSPGLCRTTTVDALGPITETFLLAASWTVNELARHTFKNLVWSCWSPNERLPRGQIGEGSPDMVGTGEIKHPRWTKTSTTDLWRRGKFKG